MDTATKAQLTLITDIKTALEANGLRWWLFGGWGLDAHLGSTTRNHSDIEFWIERSDAEPVRDALLSIGAEAVETQPIEESREFTRDGIICSSAFFDRNDDGTFRVEGRWSDWVFPTGSFDGPPCELDGFEVPAMSVEGMLAMKEQYPTLRNGSPLRDKDVHDAALLRKLQT